MIYQKVGIGETSMEQTGFLGAEISTFPNTVEVAGLMPLPVPLLTELTLPETEHGLTFHYRHKFLSIAKQEDHATVETQQECMFLPKIMAFLKKLAKLTKPKTQTNFHAQISKNA